MFESLADALLFEALDDWMSLDVAVGVGQHYLSISDERAVLPPVLDVLGQLVRDEALVVGAVGDQGFVNWEGTLEENLTRVGELVARGGARDWGHDAWFDLTHRGRERATSIVRPPDDYFD